MHEGDHRTTRSARLVRDGQGLHGWAVNTASQTPSTATTEAKTPWTELNSWGQGLMVLRAHVHKAQQHVFRHGARHGLDFRQGVVGFWGERLLEPVHHKLQPVLAVVAVHRDAHDGVGNVRPRARREDSRRTCRRCPWFLNICCRLNVFLSRCCTSSLRPLNALTWGLLLSLATPVAWGQKPGEGRPKPKIAAVSGTVLDASSGEALPFASVVVTSARDSSILGGVLSQEDGTFNLEEIEVGRLWP